MRALIFLIFGLIAQIQMGFAQSAPVHGGQAAANPATPSGGNPFLRYFTEAEWYLSWGTSTQSWANTDIHVVQPSLGNDFTISSVRGVDDGFGLPQILQGNLFGPQYNVRIGRFFDEARTIGVEFSLDHTKYSTVIGQVAPVSGLVGGVPTNAPFALTQQFFSEILHNGANHVMISGVYRVPLLGQVNDTWSVSALMKVGGGVMLPHTTDTVMGLTNNVGPKTFGNAVGLTNGWWQLNGWTTGAEAALRFVLYKPVYIEVSDKVAYAWLADLPAAQGNISHSLWMNEIVASLGITFDGHTFSNRH